MVTQVTDKKEEYLVRCDICGARLNYDYDEDVFTDEQGVSSIICCKCNHEIIVGRLV